ncbi:helix-turn-helix domain-containing protein [Ornithinimicrobium cryptoxanthini]|uniref:Helix-turn-helix domain-containing protein n=1 Tax=Ornithinimicrobium cryptoxanthini TaxID=2934161 RepID=A0ABY4YIX4_9MICO|nr:helix-turn-helix domain-containing protein [Ornithinimicrobium cryptoxanthini]USQ76736.1 helix-turn-helix domain-containing protein [Ornithinimicrobium cryptoxanthini]
MASTPDERARLLTQLDPSVPVLVLPSVAAAQQWLSAQGAGQGQQPGPGAVAAQEAAQGAAPRQQPTEPGVRLHQDRQALGFGSVEVTLTALEFALLRLLIREPGRVWRFDELVHQVWGTDHVGDTSQVHALVKRLRAKLARERAPMAIEAVRGVGFRAVRPRRRPAH